MSKKRIYLITASAMLTAVSIVFERVIPITPPSNTLDIRITLANVPLILAGLLISPIMGGVCGVVSDLIGCVISGYPPFPILTLAPLMTGLVPGLIYKAAALESRPYASKTLKAAVTVFAVLVSHIISSLLITTYGLSVMRGVGFVPMLISRIPSMLIGFVIDAVLVCILLAPLKKALKRQ